MTARTFRIHRDLRFAKDKTPYNAHLRIGFTLVSGGDAPSWFFGLDPDRLVLGLGVLAFSKSGLEAYRRRLTGAEGEDLAQRLASLTASGARLDPPELKRTPPGFDSDGPCAELARRKGLAVWLADLPARAAAEPGLLARSLETFETGKPVFDWLARLES